MKFETIAIGTSAGMIKPAKKHHRKMQESLFRTEFCGVMVVSNKTVEIQVHFKSAYFLFSYKGTTNDTDVQASFSFTPATI